jgi:hypothetical protein
VSVIPKVCSTPPGEFMMGNQINDDVMRMQHRTLTTDEQAQIVAVKGNAASLHGFLGTLGASRELSLAKTKLEEAVMWAVKHVTG